MSRIALACAGIGCGPAPYLHQCAADVPMESIDQLLATIPDLPEPTLDCFLVSLQRPLGIELTSDVFSTQPAQGVRSPRIFIRSEQLTLTVVPVGQGAHLLEFGEAHPSGFTVKAEVAFPVEQPYDSALAFEWVLARPGADATGCQVCHFNEIRVADDRFASNPIRPPDDMIVPLEILLDEHATCDWGEDPVRCGMYAALLDHGDVEHSAFPADITTQFGP